MAIVQSLKDWDAMVYGRPAKIQNILTANPEFTIRKLVQNNTGSYKTGGIAYDLGGNVVYAEGISDKLHLWRYNNSTGKFQIFNTNGELSNNSTDMRSSTIYVKVWRRTK